jgi:hypothetical protein
LYGAVAVHFGTLSKNMNVSHKYANSSGEANEYAVPGLRQKKTNEKQQTFDIKNEKPECIPSVTRDTTDTMQKQLRTRRKVKVHDIVQHWNIDTTSRHICNHQQTRFLGAKTSDIGVAHELIHTTVHGRAREVSQRQNGANPVDLLSAMINKTSSTSLSKEQCWNTNITIPSRDKNDSLLLIWNQFSQNVHQCTDFLLRSTREHENTQQFRYFNLGIQTNLKNIG